MRSRVHRNRKRGVGRASAWGGFWLIGILVLAVVAAGVGLLLTSAGVFGRRRPNVVLISIDTCRPDYLSCYGRYAGLTPKIDALAREGTLFSNVISPIPLTLPAHTSMLTGLIPPCHGVHDNLNYRVSDSSVTLAERLRDHGYKTAAIIGAFVLDSQFGLDQGFDSYDDRLGEQHKFMGGYSERPGGDVTRLANEWLDKAGGEPFFLFLHYFDPHHPYNPPEPYASGAYADNPYAGEVAYADHCVGQVIDKLKSLELYDSAMIIVVSDHGESLGEHGESKHGYFIYHSTTKVPLIVKLPWKRNARTVEEKVGLIDIVPTVLTQVGLPPAQDVHGMDLSDLTSGHTTTDRKRYLYSESLTATRYGCNSLFAAETDRWKYIQTTQPELYDLTNDPKEANNLADEDPKRVEAFRDTLQLTLQSCLLGNRGGAHAELAREAIRRLGDLGYADTPVEELFKFDASREDPKSFVELFTKIEALDYYVDTAGFDEARKICEEILAGRPEIAHVHAKLGQIAIQTGDYNEAFIRYTEALKLDPDRVEWHVNLGILFSKRRQFDEAEEHFHEALRLAQPVDDESGDLDRAMVGRGYFDLLISRAHHNLGNTRMEQGRLEDAVKEYREALRFDAQDANVYHQLGVALRRLERLDEAAEAFRSALLLNPNHTPARRALDVISGD